MISIIASSIYHELNEWSKISIQRQILNAEVDVGIPVYFGFISVYVIYLMSRIWRNVAYQFSIMRSSPSMAENCETIGYL